MTDPDLRSRPSGWAADWQLLETPESRRLDVRVKSVTVLEATLLAAFCAELSTAVILRSGVWAVLLLPPSLALTFAVGPPRLPPITALMRLAFPVVLADTLLGVLTLLLLAAECADHFYMPRLLATGTGGPLPSARATRRQRVLGLREVKKERAERLLQRFKRGST